MDPLDGGACFDISEDGTLAYLSGGVISRNADIGGSEREPRTDPEIRTGEQRDQGIP